MGINPGKSLFIVDNLRVLHVNLPEYITYPDLRSTTLRCSAMLFPVVVTVYATWWILEFFDNFFSPVYEYLLGFHVFGLGFITSMLFIFATGKFWISIVGICTNGLSCSNLT